MEETINVKFDDFVHTNIKLCDLKDLRITISVEGCANKANT